MPTPRDSDRENGILSVEEHPTIEEVLTVNQKEDKDNLADIQRKQVIILQSILEMTQELREMKFHLSLITGVEKIT